MKVRTFHVKSMHEAIQSIKNTLGPDAVILSTKRVRSWDNGFGLLGGSMLEVMAAIEDDAAIPAPAPLLGEADRPDVSDSSRLRCRPEESRFQKTLQGRHGYVRRPAANAECTPGAERHTGRLAEPWATSRGRTEGNGVAIHSFQRVYEDLLAQGVEHATAEGCLRELQETLVEPGSSQRHSSLHLLRTVLLARVTTAGPLLSTGGEQKIALFIGPSGVGKTSTIAKLSDTIRHRRAAEYCADYDGYLSACGGRTSAIVRRGVGYRAHRGEFLRRGPRGDRSSPRSRADHDRYGRIQSL